MDKDKRVIEDLVERFKEMKIKKAGPAHCSGEEAEEIFRKRYDKNFISIAAGQILKI